MASQDQNTLDVLLGKLGKLGNQLENLVKNAEGKKTEVSEDLLERLTRELEQIRKTARAQAHNIYESGQAGLEEVGAQVRKNPLTSLVIAFGAGFIVSCLFRHLR